MSIRYDHQPGYITISMPYEITDFNTNNIIRDVETLLKKHTPSTITIDFSETSVMNGDSYKVITAIKNTARQYGGTVSFYNISSSIQYYLTVNNIKT